MKMLRKKIFYLITFAMLIGFSNHLSANLDHFFSSYWFAGDVYISGDPDLNYTICTYNPNTKKYELSAQTFPTNIVNKIGTLMNGIGNCPYLRGDTQGTAFLLIPNKPFTDFQHPENAPQFQKDLLAGKEAPYIYVELVGGIINIYIVGPTTLSKFASQKLSFNFLDFEQTWVQHSWWYNGLGPYPEGMAFAFSFDATTGIFLNSPGQPLSNESFYIVPLDKNDSGIDLGPSWTSSSQNTRVMPGNTFTMQTLQNQGIMQHTQPFVPQQDLQRVIDYINASGKGKFEDVWAQ